MNDANFRQLVKLAFAEDLGKRGDVTSRSIFSKERTVARLTAKEGGILCGLDHFEAVFHFKDRLVKVKKLFKDGDAIKKGDLIAILEGKTVSLLEAERTAINFISFLSGIATLTAKCVAVAKKRGDVVLLDTRKTLPGYRTISKYAVLIGGGENHRMGLFDMVMIKDNHIDASGSITKAVARVRKRWSDRFKIEVECRSLDDVAEAIDAKADIIMLDNFSVEDTVITVERWKDQTIFEASGNMDLEKIARYSSTGIQYISSGMLTHSVKAFDFSLTIDNPKSKRSVKGDF